ncbi:MAG: restriction endonuclease subunit S [Mameliella sp.]|nr:restriction endonuclease subunit S [Phaeodactylibacter sp.]
MKWERVELGEVCEILSGSTPSRAKPNYWNGDIPWVTPKDLSGNSSKYLDSVPEYITDEGYKSCSAKMLPPESLLFSSRAPIGHLAITKFSLCTNQGFKSMVPSDKLNIDYLYFCIKANIEKIKQLGRGATFKEVSKSSLAKFQIPLPPLPEQRRLAARLDKADAVRQKSRAVVEAYGELGRSVFLEVFGDPVRNPHNFPKGKIEDLVSEVKYGTSKKAGKEGKFKYLRMNNITYSGDLNLDKLKYIDLTEKEQLKYLVKKGDILFNRTNSKELVGKTTVFNRDEQMAIAGYIIRVRTNELADPYYISGYLNSIHGKMVLENMCKNIVGMANINAKELQSIPILIPPLDLQTRFAGMVGNIEAQRRLAERQLEAAEAVFGGVLQGVFGEGLEVRG